MFWTIVGALFFFFVILPIIVQIGFPIAGAILSSKTFWKIVGWIVIGIFVLCVISYFQGKDYQARQAQIQDNKAAYMSSLRTAIPGRYGFVVLQELENGTFQLAINTIYNNENQCYQASWEYSRRYFVDRFDLSCELL